ncbi:MAG: transposase [Nitrososphaera sp.]|nr:transposase [Nitrososphaera sp.]
MAYRRTEFAENEWYHCYTRTIDKSRPFEEQSHVERFLETLYLANDSAPIPRIPTLHDQYSHSDIFSLPREQCLVAIGGYCIMPTHYHILLQPLTDSGVTDFMHKLGTSFTRSYNGQHKRVGNLFVKPFRSKHVSDDSYLHRVSQYIHLNPIELFEPRWKQGVVTSYTTIEQRLLSYPYNSLLEYHGQERPQSSILDPEAMALIGNNVIDLHDSLREMIEYYQFLELDL